MTAAGWVIMILACSGMTTLLGWCIFRVLAAPEASGKLHTQADIDTRDRE